MEGRDKLRNAPNVPPEIIPAAQSSGLLLICDHASNHMPAEFNDLGLTRRELGLHAAIDVGAAMLTRHLARDLGAPAILATISRLVIDFNRAPGGPDSILSRSHGVAIPGNAGLEPSEAARRKALYFQPYHDRIAETLTAIETSQKPAFLFSIHSFAPYLDAKRPWHVGVLWDRDQTLAEPLLAALYEHEELVVGANQPYSGHSPLGFTCQTHGDAKRRPNVIFEIRQDLIERPQGVDAMAEILAPVIASVTAKMQEQQEGGHDGD